MPKLLPRDPDTVDRAWQLLEQGAAKREIMRVLGYAERASTTNLLPALEDRGLLCWTDDDGTLRPYRRIE
jgi:hypothetical protein